MMKKILISMALMLLSTPVLAGEEALYDPAPPADAAFVRTLQLNNDQTSSLQLDGRALPKVGDNGLTAYSVIKQGNHDLSFNDKKEKVMIEAQKYYTLVGKNDGSIQVISDKVIENPSKSMIYFYNLSDADTASLVAPTHKAVIFEKIASSSADAREINAVEFDLTVKANDQDVTTHKAVSLKRQMGTSVFLVGQKGQYSSFVIDNTIQK